MAETQSLLDEPLYVNDVYNLNWNPILTKSGEQLTLRMIAEALKEAGIATQIEQPQ